MDTINCQIVAVFSVTSTWRSSLSYGIQDIYGRDHCAEIIMDCSLVPIAAYTSKRMLPLRRSVLNHFTARGCVPGTGNREPGTGTPGRVGL